jgi:hypothetical protein
MASDSASGQLRRLQVEVDGLAARWPVAPAAGAQAIGEIARVMLHRSPAKSARRTPPSRKSPGRASLIGFAKLIGLRGKHRSDARPMHLPESGPPDHNVRDTRSLLLGFILPLWLSAGIADWLRHRRPHVDSNEAKTGSTLHLLRVTEATLPVVAGLFLEITSPILLLMLGAVVAHGAIALWEMSDAAKRRQVTPIAQHVHSYVELAPVVAAVAVGALHWPEVAALLGFGDRSPDWSVRLTRKPLARAPVAALGMAMLALEAASYLEELQSTRRSP